MKEFNITIKSISDGDEVIEFAPPVCVECSEDYPDSFSPLSFRLDWDFGMTNFFSFEDFFLREDLPIEEKARRKIDFELCHSFFHCQQDPNYSVLNWALCGNLKNRKKFVDKAENKSRVE